MLRRISLFLTVMLIAVITLLTVSFTTVHAEDANAWALNNVNLRSQPGTSFEIRGVLEPNTAVVIEGRNADMTWVLVHVAGGGPRGWSLTSLFKRVPSLKLASVPVSMENVAPNSQAAPNNASSTTAAPNATPDLGKVPVYAIPSQPLPSNIPTGAIKEPILPVISSSIRAQMRVVFRRGKMLGNNPRVFSKVGDCHTDHPFFFETIGNGSYSLGKYAYLQDVINYFSVAPRPGAGNSFNVRSMAAHSAFTSGAVLDWQESIKVSVDQCQEQESPLRCEYRMDKPAVAIIMFGVVDVITMTPADFNKYMRLIVQDSINHGVIPVLSTEAENPASPNSRLFNQIIVRIAKEKYLPLINLEAALATLPNKGLESDGIHLTRPGGLDQAAVFTDGNLTAGYTMRNLVTLQALDIIWKQILS